MKKYLVLLSLLCAMILSLQLALAVEPGEILEDPVLEARAREISKELRCLVCQNQSIDDSNADLAKDLRIIVRERLTAGDSDSEAKAYLVERYGSYVLLNPPVNIQTTLLWVGPLIILFIGFISVFFWYRGRQKDTVHLADSDAKAQKLTAEEQATLDALLKGE